MKFLQSLLILLLISIVSIASHRIHRKGVAVEYLQPDTTVYAVVQVPPKFPGGVEAMFQFIQSASKYPVSLKKGALVQLKLLVEKDGSISDVKINFTDVKEELAQEAKRIITTMPKWLPGSQDGRLLRSYMLVPVRFTNSKKP